MKHIFYYLILILTLSSCNEINDDVKDLKKHVSLKIEPKSTQFKIEKIGDGRLGPSDYTLIAEIEFEKKDLEQLKKQVKTKSNHSFYAGFKKESLDFLSPEIFEIFDYDKTSEKYKINVTTYEAQYFYANPLINGFCIFPKKGNRIFLYLFTT
ncbi:hypothetical protein ABGT15_13075 [Flavobacterium enshiense]|uniref:hypothetical protein n=1 Tax=Flavobacterium enshiense TaxID=1341165 RepID=UPI00345C826C